MEGEVLMVRLGASDEVMNTEEDVVQGSSYMELRPSTTLLVPMELMGGPHSLADTELDLPELQPTIVADDPQTETHFSLTLDMDEELNKEAGLLPVECNLQSSDPSTQSEVVDAIDECLVRPELILLGVDEQDTFQPGEPLQKEILQGNDVDGPNEAEPAELLADIERECTEAKQEAEVTEEPNNIELETLTEDQDSASEAGPPPVKDPPAAVNYKDLVVTTEASKEMVEENKTTAAEEKEDSEENGPVDININSAPSAEMEPAIEEQHQNSEDAQNSNDDINTEKETKKRGRGRPKKDAHVQEERSPSNTQQEEDPVVSDTPSSKRKKAPSTPTRRTTRARRAVTFVSPVLEEAENPDDGNVEDAETSTVIPASPSRTPRKGKQVKETKVSTPRRSTRKAQLDPPTDEVETTDNETLLASTTKASSPARRSQRASATRTSQRTQSGSEEADAPTEVEIQEDVVTETKIGRTSSKTPTPAKRRTTEASTPRRSRRKILSSSEVEPAPLDICKEEKEKDESPPVKRNSRRTRTVQSEMILDEAEDKKHLSSPGRTTRQSQRITLQVYPQVRILQELVFK